MGAGSKKRRTMQSEEVEVGGDDFVVDFSQVEERSEDPIPMGQYLIEVVGAELGKTKEGKPFMQLKFKVADGDLADRTFTDRMYLNEEALWRAKKGLRAFGFDVESKLDFTAVTTEILGRQCEVTTKVDTLPLDKKKVARVSRYIPPGGEDEEGGSDDEEETF